MAIHASLAAERMAAHHRDRMGKRYRQNVAAILQRADGKILMARRSDFPESWQFPQGGKGKNESAEEALRREVAEEVSLPAGLYRVELARGGYRYDFPWGPDRHGFSGQEQSYFLCRLELGAEDVVDPMQGCGEFTASTWVDIASFPFHLVPPMKQEVYRQVMSDFFGAKSECH